MTSIDFEKELIFIHLPKCAGTYLQSILSVYGMVPYNYLSLDYKRNVYSYKNIGISEYFNNDKILYPIGLSIEKIKNYKKFTCVRSPYTRFISAWKFMIEQGLFGDITLKEMIENKDKIDGNTYNHIFVTMTSHLKDWEIHDVIKMENLEDELSILLNKYGIEKSHMEDSKNVSSDYGDPMKYYYENLEILDFVNSYFKDDFINYNYEMFSKEELIDLIDKNKLSLELNNENGKNLVEIKSEKVFNSMVDIEEDISNQDKKNEKSVSKYVKQKTKSNKNKYSKK